jgi:hypothetical protein
MTVDVRSYAGEECVSGTGLVITFGYDVDHDGTVDLPTNVSYVCNGANGTQLSASDVVIVTQPSTGTAATAICPDTAVLIGGSCSMSSDALWVTSHATTAGFGGAWSCEVNSEHNDGLDAIAICLTL